MYDSGNIFAGLWFLNFFLVCLAFKCFAFVIHAHKIYLEVALCCVSFSAIFALLFAYKRLGLSQILSLQCIAACAAILGGGIGGIEFLSNLCSMAR
jgi:hypothetical protein